MTPKEKARKITDSFYKLQISNKKTPCWDLAKKQAELSLNDSLSFFINNEFDSRCDYIKEVLVQLTKL